MNQVFKNFFTKGPLILWTAENEKPTVITIFLLYKKWYALKWKWYPISVVDVQNHSKWYKSDKPFKIYIKNW